MDLSLIVTKSYGWMICHLLSVDEILWQHYIKLHKMFVSNVLQYHGISSERLCPCFPFVFQFVSKCMISMVLGI